MTETQQQMIERRARRDATGSILSLVHFYQTLLYSPPNDQYGLEWPGRLIIEPRRPVLSLSKGSGGATSSATRSFYTACSNNAWACCALGAESLFVDVAP